MISYTLLVIESPTIARIINSFRIPSLEVIPTNGYCWKPFYDPINDQLKIKADPDRLEVRRILRNKIPWAHRVIIATDSDNAGEFIAWTLWRHFHAKNNLYRSYLNALSRNGIEEMIDSARPLSDANPGSNRNKRILYHVIQRQLEPVLGSFAWIKLALIRLFNEPIYFKKTKAIESHAVTDPYNTADVLCIARPLFSSFSEAQDALNRLFSEIPASLESGLISYPRTDQRGFYRGTLDFFYRNWVMEKPAESFLPPPLWPVIDEKHPHEAIHPLSLEIKPNHVRPYLRKRSYDLYTLIYDRTIKSVQAPFATEQTGLNMPDANANDHELMPRINNILDGLCESGVIKPSSYGNITDKLITDGWLQIKDTNGAVVPGVNLKWWLDCPPAKTAVNECLSYAAVQDDLSVNRTQLLSLLQRIIRLSEQGTKI